jgi:hypothetical protein
METYRATARQSWAEERRRLALRHERAWAAAQLLALDAAFEVDLVMGEEIPASLLAVIKREGRVV